jgi:hypothetical protein
MNTRPLTERQEQVLMALLDAKHGPTAHYHYPMPPNDIACAIGLNANRARRASTTWSGSMGPAQRVIGSLTGLRGRELIANRGRPDGLSGTAYALTDSGERRAIQLKASA